jgi:hypothetical protein
MLEIWHGPKSVWQSKEEIGVKFYNNLNYNQMSVKVLVPGHQYELSHFDNPEESTVISFINKRPKQDGEGVIHSGEMEVVFDGVINEDLLIMLLNRLKFLFDKFPSGETAMAIGHLTNGLGCLLARTEDRKIRQVEGKHLS